MPRKTSSATASITLMSSYSTPGKDVDPRPTIEDTPKLPESISATKTGTTNNTASTSNYSVKFVSTKLIVDSAPILETTP